LAINLNYNNNANPNAECYFSDLINSYL